MNEELFQLKQPETCLQRLKREHPGFVEPHLAGGACGCPSFYGYAGSPQWCKGFGDKKLCAACWNRPAK